MSSVELQLYVHLPVEDGHVHLSRSMRRTWLKKKSISFLTRHAIPRSLSKKEILVLHAWLKKKYFSFLSRVTFKSYFLEGYEQNVVMLTTLAFYERGTSE